MLLARRNGSGLSQTNSLDHEESPKFKCTPRKFSELFQLLSSLQSYLSLTHHPDIALRIVIFDPSDDTKIAGVIDWGGAQIVPLCSRPSSPPTCSP
ncbi:hypothetical protein K503DRAFT_343949 [Rhizopogon vinicolor AM-OR11-026]|uniref:Uncharacterized protein n=1 Tax=Rhizopogon vinicolor AM-OR11-026 TaxID=1314800 RepID=A0A1B7MT76_9AGAM|nr:hypothetical protein K503DRAFT_343949 [Rhizopogon vinicolor AM-OR11-026]